MLQVPIPLAEGKQKSLGQQGFLRREVISNGSEADASCRRDIPRSGAVVALLDQANFRRLQ
jgi:hypothetical protein